MARARWVSVHIIPCERQVRAWLSRWGVRQDDSDEIIQDAYCRIATLDTVSHIDDPRAYFFSIVRNLAIRRLRRESIVKIETIAEIDACHDLHGQSPERQAADRQEYECLLGLIRALPIKCRQIMELRKIEGWSQREIAQHLGISEKTVEKQLWLGLKAVRLGWSRVIATDKDRWLRSARK
ncbi:sigma-70 family RNA polymerase sigma factor [Sphingomonas sp. AP4-R1]|uniref:RNA polymerase sigma factor n=1 Tax=Sphingomonas sp. AP4-R1 TaxID=2735134 RepID=UPI0014938006|nr:sigma-70 family RNA polymerase sigma factor [Sphingomonas sp. AP4-R1]QJU60115.1 sigma-70 family RNA polymerase sigma factor [Sphingomonas sp. AP4-R1]